jgi:hypothetical protein
MKGSRRSAEYVLGRVLQKQVRYDVQYNAMLWLIVDAESFKNSDLTCKVTAIIPVVHGVFDAVQHSIEQITMSVTQH